MNYVIISSISILLIFVLYIKRFFSNQNSIVSYLSFSTIWLLICLLIIFDHKLIACISSVILLFLRFFYIVHIQYSKIIKLSLFIALIISCIITVFIMLSIFIQAIYFFHQVDFLEFLFCPQWHYNVIMIENTNDSIGTFGIIPLLVGTLVITIVAMLFAIPLGLFSALYISEYASEKIRYIVNTTLQILSAIPTVVYGYFSVVFLSSSVKLVASFFGLNMHSESALVAGLSIGIMILPFIISLLEDAIRSVPKTLRYGFMALGATPAETVWHIILPYAMPTIISAILLSISRVIGETMIVLMAVGINANLTFNPMNAVTTITVQIATLLTGDQDYNSVYTLAAFALSFVLFIITWILNACALFIIKRV
ncbi:phosphate ABC transporter permease subunit PstC [Wolbachia endosymbiont of Howardula sp.]|nr:phosphate ABC transporter permease subunit PstC [Wolbachia endosymbiont of Howardula sp.]UWI83431.1 phosphate ABC transporter permease subunit PstC [Wolbachia endosymbiont of Howardula sp.]